MQSYFQYRRVQHVVDQHIQSAKEKFVKPALESGEHSDEQQSNEKSLLQAPLSCAEILDSGEVESGTPLTFVVTWDGSDDPCNPKNFSVAKKVCTTLIVSLIAFAVGASAATDAAVLPQAAEYFHVSEVTESLATGVYLMGYAFGAVLAAPFSEALGRNVIYGSTVLLFGLFVMAAGLSPNIGAQIVLRFLAGFFGSTPLVCAGGTIADLWNQMEKTWAFPLYSITCFGAPLVSPVMASYVSIGKLHSWRWAEWINAMLAFLALFCVIMFMPETYGPLILKWKAQEIRKVTGDERYKSELELSHRTMGMRMKVALTRPFEMATEPIIVLMALYLTVLYIVLFTFLNGFTFIFDDVYHIGQGLTNVSFITIQIGMLFPSFLIYPVYKITQRDIARVQAEGRQDLDPEVRLWYGMFGGSIAVPVSLFWMAWTDYASVSIWSPLIAGALFGYGVLCIFITVYMYVIDSYEVYAASALTLVTFMRYLVAGGMTIVGIPFYRNMGTHWTLTILACISGLLVPLPFVFYFWGRKIRSYSKHAAVKK
ncbi:major facilitator superfamily domain-containing protein [Limtongia smithiae]|uniref:major facilitator superfamily domain-containing protein n=1 Tax=Limtongia smithiae TaxID=1125753 RepID=UPI0034CE4A87